MRARRSGSSSSSSTPRPSAAGSPGSAYSGGVAGRDARLVQVVGDDRAAHRHVLGDLDHRRDVVERARRIGREADVGGREDRADVVVAAPAGELDASPMPELGGERAHVLEHVALADEDRVPVVAALAQPRERADRVVDPVLRTHDPEVGDQVLAAALAASGSGSAGRKRSRSGPLRTTKTSSGAACRRARSPRAGTTRSWRCTTSASRNASRSSAHATR